jgi:hypothetical protein
MRVGQRKTAIGNRADSESQPRRGPVLSTRWISVQCRHQGPVEGGIQYSCMNLALITLRERDPLSTMRRSSAFGSEFRR